MATLADIFGVGGGGMFGGDMSSIYGELLTPQQKQALAYRGLMSAAAALGQAGMPSRMPIPLGAALGQAAGAMSEAQDKGAEMALKGLLYGAQAQQLKSDQALRESLLKALGLTGGGNVSGLASVPMSSSSPPVNAPVAPTALSAPAGGTPKIEGAPDYVDNAGTRTNNFGGLRMPGVKPAGGPLANPAGWQRFATPEEGIGAISRQLDRYASGATTGKPLTTIRQIVSTGAPPSENDTSALIARASRVVGVDPDQPLDIADPGVKAKLIEATIRNEQGGKLPVSPDAIFKVAGGERPVQLTQTTTALPQIAAPTFGSLAPQVPNMQMGSVNLNDPRQVVSIGILGDLAKIPSLGNLLTGTPAYRAEIARQEALAKVGPAYLMPDANPTLQGQIAGAREGAKHPYDIDRATVQAALDRATKAQEQRGAASLDPTTIIETLPNGQRVERQVTRKQYADMVSGQTVPGKAQPPSTPAQQGGLQPGGAIYGKPYQTPAEAEFGQAVGRDNAKEFFERRALAQNAATSLESSNEARRLLDSGVITGTGATYLTNLGKALRTVGFNAHFNDVPNTEAFAATRAQEVGRIIKLFGSGTGLSNADREYAERAAAGQITLDEQSIRRILDINDRASRTIIEKFNLDAERVPTGLSPYPLTVQPPGLAGGKSGVTSSGVHWSLQ